METLDVAGIISALDPSYWRVRHFESIDSTQLALVSAVNKGLASAGDVYVAEYQSHGRGRLNRTFQALPGQSILISLVIAPAMQDQRRWGWVPLVAGVATCEAINEVAALYPELKWPNDVMIGGKKVAGIIAEKVGKLVVVGIGINVLQDEASLPLPTATSINLSTENKISRNELVAALLNRLAASSALWDHSPLVIENKYRQLSATLEEPIIITLPNGEEFRARAVAIAASGALVLEDGRELVAGDVTHLRSGK